MKAVKATDLEICGLNLINPFAENLYVSRVLLDILLLCHGHSCS